MTGLLSLVTLAWRPFLEPLPLHEHWMWLLLPLTLIISLVYKTLKTEDLSKLAWQTLRLTITILVFMVIAAVVLWAITEML